MVPSSKSVGEKIQAFALKGAARYQNVIIVKFCNGSSKTLFMTHNLA
jgi:hypothetical protein